MLTNGGHACLMESELHFRWNLHDDMIAEFPDEGAVCAGCVNQMTRLARILFQAMHLGANGQSAQGIRVTFVWSN